MRRRYLFALLPVEGDDHLLASRNITHAHTVDRASYFTGQGASGEDIFHAHTADKPFVGIFQLYPRDVFHNHFVESFPVYETEVSTHTITIINFT